MRFTVHWREPCRQQKCIALTQRHLEPSSKPQHHLAARIGASGLYVTEVASGDVSIDGKLLLTQAAAVTPGAQMLTKRGSRFVERNLRSAGGHAHELILGRI